jgi:hypothetical protein
MSSIVKERTVQKEYQVLLGDSDTIEFCLSYCCTDCIDHLHLALRHCFIHRGFLMAVQCTDTSPSAYQRFNYLDMSIEACPMEGCVLL